MYIICNNCGTTIDFPDYPHQVICSSCNTYLQVEEENDRIVATIIEESEFDNSIFQQQNLPINSHYFGDLFICIYCLMLSYVVKRLVVEEKLTKNKIEPDH